MVTEDTLGSQVAGPSEVEIFKQMGECWILRSMVNDKRMNRMYNIQIKEPKEAALKKIEE